MTPLTYELRGRAAWLTLDRPDAMNALSDALIAAIVEALDRAAEDADARSVVIAANGRMFCAGADLKESQRHMAEPDGVGAFVARAAAMLERVAAHPQPVIAAVQGGAIAGGLELVLACDLVVAAQRATFADGHAHYGLFPGAGGTTRLPRLIGATRAKQLLFTAEAWSAERMHACGLVNEVVPDEQLHAAAERLTEQIGARSPLGLARMKRVVDAGLDLPLGEALALEQRVCAEHSHSADLREGLDAFLERREPHFTGN